MVTSATGAVRPSSSALVATVVPWARTSGRSAPTSAATPCAHRAGRDRRGSRAPWPPAVGRHDVGEGASGVGPDPHRLGTSSPVAVAARSRSAGAQWSDHRVVTRGSRARRGPGLAGQGARRRRRRATPARTTTPSRSTTTSTRWWAQREVSERGHRARPRPRRRPAGDRAERDILAEHFGEDWRTNFARTPRPTLVASSGSAEHEHAAAARRPDADPVHGARQPSRGRDAGRRSSTAHRRQAARAPPRPARRRVRRGGGRERPRTASGDINAAVPRAAASAATR